MPQLTRGARKALDQVATLATTIRNNIALARDRAKFNPDFSRDKLDIALTHLTQLETLVNEDIAQLLERQAPEYEKRLAALEAWRESIEVPADGKVIQLRKAE